MLSGMFYVCFCMQSALYHLGTSYPTRCTPLSINFFIDDKFFVSIDVSAIDPTDLIAAGRATPNGLRLDEVTQAIRHVCASKEIVGFEITDLAVYLDFSKRSVMHANAVLNACLNGIAEQKSGLDADYVHPLALDHGQR